MPGHGPTGTAQHAGRPVTTADERPVDPGDERSPVLVGVGAADAEASGAAAGLYPGEPADLMVAAVESALADAGAPSLRRAVDRISVPQGTWAYPDPARLVADAVGATGARSCFAELGVSQQTLVSEALRAVAGGHSEVAVVVGGEARARSQRALRAGATAPETAQPGVTPDLVQRREPEFFARSELDAGVVVPVVQYALIENALRAAEGTDPVRHREEIAALWARCNVVARDNPRAAFPSPRSAEQIAEPGPGNRPMASPYNKWHVSQMTVDQSAALIVCSRAAARRHGIPRDRWVTPLVAIDANHAVSLSRRRWLHRWPAMEVLGRAAEARIGRPLADAELLEVYSCFPSAVRVQQRELGLPRDGTPTFTGGMSFAGGPFNNFVYQATAALVPALRRSPGALGVVTTVCGLLTKPGLAVWCTEPDGRAPLLRDFAEESARATPVVDDAADYRGPARLASYTLQYDAEGPAQLVVLCDLPDGRRQVATSDDRALAEAALTADLIGTQVAVAGSTLRGVDGRP